MSGKVSERTFFKNHLFGLFNLLVEPGLFTEMDPNCYYNIADGRCATWSSCCGTVRYVPNRFKSVVPKSSEIAEI